jgi:hypothetical protein
VRDSMDISMLSLSLLLPLVNLSRADPVSIDLSPDSLDGMELRRTIYARTIF